jgi:Uma2 family endonuclease
MVSTNRMSVAELERHGGPEGHWELIDGELVEVPAARPKHGRIGGAFVVHVGAYAFSQNLGYVYLSETGFVIAEDPPTLRMPDVSFIRRERLPEERDPEGFFRIPPDLVVEVISPSDRMADVLTKVSMWLEFGVRLVWLVAPESETVTVFRPDREPRTLSGDESLDGEDVLPGFNLPLRQVFAS